MISQSKLVLHYKLKRFNRIRRISLIQKMIYKRTLLFKLEKKLKQKINRFHLMKEEVYIVQKEYQFK
jgi:hypothetical protein